jgi:hypothetical protein
MPACRAAPAPSGILACPLLTPDLAAGKTTLLQLIAGKYMVNKKTIVVLGQSPFHDLVRPLLLLHPAPPAAPPGRLPACVPRAASPNPRRPPRRT